jgi:hypothetical protein
VSGVYVLDLNTCLFWTVYILRVGARVTGVFFFWCLDTAEYGMIGYGVASRLTFHHFFSIGLPFTSDSVWLNSSIRAGDPTEGYPDIGCECTCLPPSPSLRLARGAAAKRAPGSCLARLAELDLLLHPTVAILSLPTSSPPTLSLITSRWRSALDLRQRSLRYWGSQSPRATKTSSLASSFIHPPAGCSSSTGCGLLLLEPDPVCARRAGLWLW